MASIFLSYAREDMPKAKALAKALERAGHSVWWDRHLRGGSEFAGEIEGALKRADVVLVLWSETSISSAWVRDEAAEGRDSGRLLPVMLDECVPPLGFRQIHSISIAGWSGRGNPPNFDDILAAIGGRADKDQRPTERPSPAAPRKLSRPLLIGLAALVLLVAAIGAWTLLGKRSEASVPVLAVLPFADLSPQRDKAYFAEGVAEAILTVLAKERGIRVIGRSTAEQLHKAGADSDRMRRALGVTHVLEGSARSAGDQLRMSVRLIDASDGQQLWAEEYQRRLDNVFAVQDEIGQAVAQRLKGSFASRDPAAAQLTKSDVYTLYLAARAKMRDRRKSSLQDALRIARQVIAADPNYAPGHALYAELINHMSIDNYGTLSADRARQLAEPHAREAIRLAPNSAEGYAALGMMAVGAEAIGPLKTAIRLDPARAELRLWLGNAYNHDGRHEQALEQIVEAAEIDPLWFPAVVTHAYMLSASGKGQEAEATLARFERRGGSPAVAAKIRADLAANHRGDYSGALRLLRFALAADPEVPLGQSSLAWSYRMLGFRAEAAEAAKAMPRFTRLLMAGDHPRLRSEALLQGPRLWQQPDPDTAVEALMLLRDWTSLGRLHDQSPDGRQTVCDDPRSWVLQQAINFATALAATNRSKESNHYLRCVKSMLAPRERGVLRSPYLPQSWIDMTWAQIHALEGQPEPAFQRLDRAIRHGFRTRFGAGLSDLAAFDRYRGSPAYAAADLRLKQLIARERAEVLQAKDSRA